MEQYLGGPYLVHQYIPILEKNAEKTKIYPVQGLKRPVLCIRSATGYVADGTIPYWVSFNEKLKNKKKSSTRPMTSCIVHTECHRSCSIWYDPLLDMPSSLLWSPHAS